MGESTGIQWTEKTWNPLQGCHKLSAGCKNCYMFSEKKRYGQDPNTVVRSKDATFYAPLKWKEPSLIFTCSWSDWFIEEGDAHRDDMWGVIRQTPHIYQILTKRADRIAGHLPVDWGEGWKNVWLGVSVENQKERWRIDALRNVAAAVRFLSCEPLVEDVGKLDLTGIHWVIVGGESGHGARQCDLAWIDSIVKQCKAAGVACFVKQLGACPQISELNGRVVTWKPKDKKGGDIAEFPPHFCREMPRTVAA